MYTYQRGEVGQYQIIVQTDIGHFWQEYSRPRGHVSHCTVVVESDVAVT